jgi:hypothetical protein
VVGRMLRDIGRAKKNIMDVKNVDVLVGEN